MFLKVHKTFKLSTKYPSKINNNLKIFIQNQSFIKTKIKLFTIFQLKTYIPVL